MEDLSCTLCMSYTHIFLLDELIFRYCCLKHYLSHSLRSPCYLQSRLWSGWFSRICFVFRWILVNQWFTGHPEKRLKSLYPFVATVHLKSVCYVALQANVGWGVHSICITTILIDWKCIDVENMTIVWSVLALKPTAVIWQRICLKCPSVLCPSQARKPHTVTFWIKS